MENAWAGNHSARSKLRKRLADEGRPCHLCGRPIDYSLPSGHPMSFELDHVVPLARGGDPWSYDNAAAAHRICNQRKGKRMPQDDNFAHLAIRRTRIW